MAELLAAIMAFLLTHLIPAAPGVRGFLIRAMGRGVYIAFYSLLSLAVIVWLVEAYAKAPYIEIWQQAPWMRWVPVVAMVGACVLLVAAMTSPNPLSVSFSRRPYDPTRPGVVSVTRHPLLWGLGIWAGAHMVANGDQASVLVFGLLMVLSGVGMISADAKARARLGVVTWQAMKHHQRVDWRGIGVGRLLAGLVLYAALFMMHPMVIGVSPWP